MRDTIHFRLGPEPRQLRDIDPATTVLEYLRNVEHLSGTKEGCAEGDCGACTVILVDWKDGQPRYQAVNACILFVSALDGRQLLTVEHLAAADGTLHPAQQAMVEHHGSQCGYCTPGFVMSIAALGTEATPDRTAVNEALAGNLCRCTGYRPIVDAALSVCSGRESLPVEAPVAVPDAMLALRHGDALCLAPRSVAELADTLIRYPEAVIVAGGTDVGLWVTKQHKTLGVTVSLDAVSDLAAVTETADTIRIGAGATYQEALPVLEKHYPDFGAMIRRLGSRQIRNRGTIGGNIANASPIGDSPPALLALDTTLVLRRGTEQRSVRLEDFFAGYRRTILQPGEFIERIDVPVPRAGEVFHCYKVSKRFDQDISAVCGAFRLRIEDGIVRDIRIGFGGMSATPARPRSVEVALIGRPWSIEAIRAAQAAMDEGFSPLSDMRASAAYRRTVARNLLLKVFLETGREEVITNQFRTVMAGEALPRVLGRPPSRPLAPPAPRGVDGGPAATMTGRAAGGPLDSSRSPAAPVGASIPHDSAAKHVTGRAIYIDDMPDPARLLHCVLYLSPHAHARIVSMDLSAVAASPGVAAVMSARNVPGVNDVGPAFMGDPIFADGLVEYHGQSIFAVAATSMKLAREAAAKAVIEYDVLKPIITIDEALASRSFVLPTQVMQRGDAAAALAHAPLRLSGRIDIGGQEHFYLEGQVAMAIPGEDGDMLIHSSTQHPTEVQHLVARALKLSDHAVVCETRRMGGGFGGKESQASLIAVAAALLAQRTGRPVKHRLDRDDDMILTGKRHHARIDYDVGFEKDGRIQGISFVQSIGCGYSPDLSGAIADRAMFHADNAYYLDNVHIVSHRCKTNTVSNTAFRGFGGPQGMIGIEHVVDEIARHLRIDPLTVRKRNFYGQDDRNITPYHMTVEDNIIPELAAQLEQTAGYVERRNDVAAFNAVNPWIKRGVALTPVKFGISFTLTHMNQAGALVHVYTDGSVQLNHGGTEMGQGLYTKVAQVVAAEFGMALDRVKITATTTAKVPNTSPTAASSGTDLNGKAAQAAARTIRQRMADVAAIALNVPADQVVFADGHVSGGGKELTFTDIAKLAHRARVQLSSTGYYSTPKIHYDTKIHQGRPFYYFAYGAAVAEVEVDTLTGEYRLRRVDILHDAGQSLNPAIDLGQIEGGFVQGMGWLTTEELWWDDKGHLRTHAPSTYKIPACGDVPAAFNVALCDGRNTEDAIYRSKAVGEPPLMLGIAVFQALRDAIAACGDGWTVGRLDAPATPERVLMAIEALRAEAEVKEPMEAQAAN